MAVESDSLILSPPAIRLLRFSTLLMAAGSASSDFAFLLNREGVPVDVINKFVAAGITTSRLFAAFALDAKEMRESLQVRP